MSCHINVNSDRDGKDDRDRDRDRDDNCENVANGGDREGKRLPSQLTCYFTCLQIASGDNRTPPAHDDLDTVE